MTFGLARDVERDGDAYEAPLGRDVRQHLVTGAHRLLCSTTREETVAAGIAYEIEPLLAMIDVHISAVLDALECQSGQGVMPALRHALANAEHLRDVARRLEAFVAKQQAWRFALRERTFLDDAPAPKEVPAEVVTAILRRLDVLRREWDAIHPESPTTR